MNACREMTVREYIERMGNTELCHDYESEAKRTVELYEEEKARYLEEYRSHVLRLERQIRENDIIISCLARCVDGER